MKSCSTKNNCLHFPHKKIGNTRLRSHKTIEFKCKLKSKNKSIIQQGICFSLNFQSLNNNLQQTGICLVSKGMVAFTTEQVEDVRVMLNILKILFTLGPVFLLEATAFASYFKHRGFRIEGSERNAISNIVPMLVS